MAEIVENLGKVAPKFVLPSPNLDKPNVSKCHMHYLTPSGMTLLPRAKQPPPMYGALGSTVPAKYLQTRQKKIQDAPPIYVEPPQPKYCANCNMQLATEQDMRRHVEQHEDCPMDDCSFAALANVLESHIESNHVTGLYKSVKKAWTPEEIAAWREERRSRYPTAANKTQMERAREQRLKRGERIERSKAKFGNAHDRRRTRPHIPNTMASPKPTNRRKTRARRIVESKQNINKSKESPAKPTEPMEENSLKNSTEEEKPLQALGMYHSEGDSEIESEKMMERTNPCENTARTDVPLREEVKPETSSSDEAPEETPVEQKTDTLMADSSSDEPPEETAIVRKTEELDENMPKLSERKPAASLKRPQLEKKPKKRVYGLNFQRARQLRKQNTLLEKLLEPQIRHERNVLLQCVRFVCEQNFFGIGGTSTS